MFTLSVRTTLTYLLGAGLALVIGSGLALIAHQGLGITRIAGVGYLQSRRVDREIMNVPTWFSSSVLLLCALCAAMLARVGRERGSELATRWWVVTALFMLMSIDEQVRIHERLDSITLAVTGLRVPWMVPAGLLLVVALLPTRRLWWQLPAENRRWLAESGAIHLAGTVGMEALAKILLRVLAPSGQLHVAVADGRPAHPQARVPPDPTRQ